MFQGRGPGSDGALVLDRDGIEQEDMVPKSVHLCEAKPMMGLINKTDKSDVHGPNHLQRNCTMPPVWILPGPLWGLYELTRTWKALDATADAEADPRDVWNRPGNSWYG